MLNADKHEYDVMYEQVVSFTAAQAGAPRQPSLQMNTGYMLRHTWATYMYTHRSGRIMLGHIHNWVDYFSYAVIDR